MVTRYVAAIVAVECDASLSDEDMASLVGAALHQMSGTPVDSSNDDGPFRIVLDGCRGATAYRHRASSGTRH